MENIKILIVEDDADINNLLAKIVKKEGYEPMQAFSGTEAQLRMKAEGIEQYSLILLDLMLPGIMGEDLIQEIRETSQLPIIVLSAKSSLDDRVNVLGLGADDYLTKPFAKQEVVARVNSALRRYLQFGNPAPASAVGANASSSSTSGTDTSVSGSTHIAPSNAHPFAGEVLTFKQITLNTETRDVHVGETALALTAHEFDLLCLFMQNPGKVFSRERLYEQIWQNGYYGEDNTVNVHISNLRKKLAAADPDTEYIRTVWGIGFKM